MALVEASTVDQNEHELLARIPQDGSAIGNIALIRALGWEEEVYWKTRNRMVERGILELGRGKGGSVRIVKPSVSPEQAVFPSGQ